ncbi:MAG: DHHA1 domain-containing protein, partial [Alphaproteobacteria bacterium]|nr:DHHA1 domain-containing protein [Alphaproteobacteria bacterium]
RSPVNPLNWLDLVALGTICDVVPLTGLNRAFAAQGLKVMMKRVNTGLAALADVAGLSEPPGAYHAGFVLGPRVNAGGRVGEAGLGAELLMGDDPSRAKEIATRLDIYNEERKAIEAACLEDAIRRVEADFAGDPVLVVEGEGWHPGVIGIVASRLKEKFSRPAFVIASEGEVAKGSGRSVPGVDMGAAITSAKDAGLLINGGGHKMAAGLTVASSRVGELRTFLNGLMGALLAEIAARPILRLDGILTPRAANAAMVEVLEQAGPFGAGHPQPRFALPKVSLVKADVVGVNHVRCVLSGSDGGRLKAIAFRALEEPLGRLLLTAGRDKKTLHIAGTLRADRWMGREEAQLFIEDAAPA